MEGKPPCSNDEGPPATEISSTCNDVRVDTDAEPIAILMPAIVQEQIHLNCRN